MSNTAAVAEVQPNEGFSYVDLNEVDPNIKPLPTDFYQLKVLKAEVKEFKYKNATKGGKQPGDIGEYIKFQLAVTNNDTYAGRRLFPTLFFGARELRTLRKLMDATGVIQAPATPIAGWLAQLAEIQPEFKVQVLLVDGKDAGPDGKPIPENQINWREILPV